MPESIKYFWPLDKIFVTQHFAENPARYAKYGMKGHNGIDLRTRFLDTPLGHRYVTAAADGVVLEANTNPKASGYGNYVRLGHADGSQTIYGHFAKPYVVKGQHVKAGDRIGLSDNTGDSTGPHVHFGIRPANWQQLYGNGYLGYVDPKPLLSLLPGQVILSL